MLTAANTAKIHPDEQALSAAFREFSGLSEQLTQVYSHLEAQVERLSAELAAARIERDRERLQYQKSAQQLSAMLEVLPAAVVMVDGRDRVDRFNAAASEWFPGLSWGRLWREIKRDQIAQIHSDGDWRLKEGREVSVAKQALGDGGFILALADVTENRHLQKALFRRERTHALGQMAAQLAHQVRTPITSALLYAGQLSNDRLDEKVRARANAKLTDRLRETAHWVDDMLAFTRGVDSASEALDLVALVKEVSENRVCLADSPVNCAIRVESPAWILGNREALLGAIRNLLENAVQHGGPRRQIILQKANGSDGYEVAVIDDGPGISAELAEKIFEPFYSTRAKGTGLGLPVVRQVAEAHGGTLSYRAGAKGGSVFAFHLPAISQQTLAEVN